MARPNILCVHTHDLGQFLHCYGVETVQTPNFDKLAAEGVRFARHYCTAPQCSPSRASIFTGRYPHNNGVMGLTQGAFGWDLHADEVHLAEMLKDAGYLTEAVGVIHETHSGHERCGYGRYEGPAKVSVAVPVAIQRLEELKQAEQPWFLSVGFIEPHRLGGEDPYSAWGFISTYMQPDDELGVQVPGYLQDEEGTRADLAELQGAVKHLDEHFGKLMQAVDDLGLRDNTLVIYTVDHGVAMPKAKCSLYDPGLETALIMRLPGRKGWHGARVVHEMISNIDLVPTLLDLLGAPVPENVQGRSFRPLLDGEAYTPRDAIFAEITHHDYYDPRRCIRTEKHKLIVNFSSAYYYMDPTQSMCPRAKPVFPKHNKIFFHQVAELYDLEKDPWELKDVITEPEYLETRQELLARLYRFLKDTNDPILDGAVTPPLHLKALEVLKEAAGQEG